MSTEVVDTITELPRQTEAQRATSREIDRHAGILERRMRGKTYRVLVTIPVTISYDIDGCSTGEIVAEDSLYVERVAMDAAGAWELGEIADGAFNAEMRRAS